MILGFMQSSSKKEYLDNHKPTKRHWVAAAVLLTVCSWITHTSTATISDNVTREDIQTFADELAFDAEPSILDIDPFSELDEQASQETPPAKIINHTIRSGESLGAIFKKLDFDLSLPYKISKDDIGKELVSLRIGRNIEFHLNSDEQIQQIKYPLNALEELRIKLENSQIISSSIEPLPFEKKTYHAAAEIQTSLYEAAQEAGLSITLIMEMVRIFGWDIDFVQDIRKGDAFKVIFSDYILDGEKIADGEILAAEFTTQGQTYRAVRYTDENGESSYYAPNGDSMLGTFLRSPVEFSRISSRFGKRLHPISKKWKRHNGVDYAAPRGTPIRSTADGKVILAGRKGGYGKTVILRHAGRIETLYAHMNGYGKGIRSGKRVKQGDIIGYVGTTGYSTGPHLHYEFRVDGVHRNPLTYKTPKASKVPSGELVAFKEIANSLIAELISVANLEYARLHPNQSLASQAKTSSI
jgi:murein DD-endopeptidase MepM/ murein hydrolase activator NlpD